MLNFIPDDPTFFYTLHRRAILICVTAREHSAVVIWDVRTQKFPIKSFEVSENLTGQFAESQAEDEFYDQFHIAISPSGKKILTGNYLSDFHILDVN